MTTTSIQAVEAGDLTRPEQLFRCKPYSVMLMAKACLRRQEQVRGGEVTGAQLNSFKLCVDCELGRVVSGRVGNVAVGASASSPAPQSSPLPSRIELPKVRLPVVQGGGAAEDDDEDDGHDDGEDDEGLGEDAGFDLDDADDEGEAREVVGRRGRLPKANRVPAQSRPAAKVEVDAEAEEVTEAAETETETAETETAETETEARAPSGEAPEAGRSESEPDETQAPARRGRPRRPYRLPPELTPEQVKRIEDSYEAHAGGIEKYGLDKLVTDVFADGSLIGIGNVFTLLYEQGKLPSHEEYPRSFTAIEAVVKKLGVSGVLVEYSRKRYRHRSFINFDHQVEKPVPTKKEEKTSASASLDFYIRKYGFGVVDPFYEMVTDAFKAGASPMNTAEVFDTMKSSNWLPDPSDLPYDVAKEIIELIVSIWVEADVLVQIDGPSPYPNIYHLRDKSATGRSVERRRTTGTDTMKSQAALTSKIATLFSGLGESEELNVKRVKERIDSPEVDRISRSEVKAILDKMVRDGVIEQRSAVRRSYGIKRGTTRTSRAVAGVAAATLSNDSFLVPEKIDGSMRKVLTFLGSYQDTALGAFRDYKSPLTTKQVADMTGIGYYCAAPALAVLMKHGFIRRVAPATFIRERINIVDFMLRQLEKKVPHTEESLAHACKVTVKLARPAIDFLEENGTIVDTGYGYVLTKNKDKPAAGRERLAARKAAEDHRRKLDMISRRQAPTAEPAAEEGRPAAEAPADGSGAISGQLQSLVQRFEHAKKVLRFKTVVWALLTQFDPGQRVQMILELAVDIDANSTPWWVIAAANGDV